MNEFDVEFERNSLKKRIELLKIEEKKKRNDLIQYKGYEQIDENGYKSKSFRM